MQYVVGRTALNNVTGSYRATTDLDIVTDEVGVTKTLPNQEIHYLPTAILNEFSLYQAGYGVTYPDLDTLYTLKVSHLEYNIHWWKTAQDILYMKKRGAQLKPKLLGLLRTHWKGVHGNKEFLNLGRTSKDFFDDFVYKKYDHDWLHTVIASPNEPMFMRCLKDGAEVEIDDDKFNALRVDDKVTMLKEEILVIATERWLTNEHNEVNDYGRAYQLALQKTVTNLTKGIQCEFICENLELFLDWPASWKTNLEQHNVMEKRMKPSWFEEFAKQSIGFNGKYNTETKQWETTTEKLYGSESYELPSILAQGEEYQTGSDMDVWLKAHGFEHISQEGGGEGGAEHCECVFKLDGKFYKTTYGYYSYDGYQYDEFLDNIKEVQPAQKTITVYE